MKTVKKALPYLLASLLYWVLVLAISLVFVTQVERGYEINKSMDTGSTVKVYFLDPTVEQDITIHAESNEVFVFRVEDDYFDSDLCPEGGKYCSDFLVGQSQLVLLVKCNDYVDIKIQAERPVEASFNFQLLSFKIFAWLLIGWAIIIFAVVSLVYWTK